MAELRELAISAGVAVVDEIIQRRPAIDPRTVLGKGKLEELLIRAMQIGADAVIFDRELQPAQVRSISEATDLKVVDRSQLILDIFAQRAQSRPSTRSPRQLKPPLAGRSQSVQSLSPGVNIAG